jgi:Xaa-Pro aminopeptidase
MEFSPKNAIPYVSKVDGGTIDLVRSFHVEVVSSADFLLNFTSVIDEEQAKSHIRANRALLEILEGTWQLVGKLQLANEWDVQQHLLAEFKQRNLITDSPPIVGVNAHSADPHFETVQKGASPIRKGDFILIDLWAKEKGERAVFGDLTRVAVMASSPTPKQQEVFQAVRNGQKAAIALVKERFQAKKPIQGWEVDEAARSSIRKAGYGDYFTHRTGHNIEMHVHGSGTHMDNLEMHDVRPLLPMTCFSIEPGIYLPGEFGVRLETDLWITKDGKVEITGGEEDHLRCLLS